MTERKPPDWERIERDYRAGMLSIREIAKLNGITDKAIRNKAKALGWERDLTAQVQEKVRRELVRTQVRIQSADEAARTEREIIEEAAATTVEVIRSHRRDISGLTRIAETLRGGLESLIAWPEVPADDAPAEDKIAWRELVDAKYRGLPQAIVSLRELTVVTKNIVTLERQAFGIKEDDAADNESFEDKLARLSDG